MPSDVPGKARNLISEGTCVKRTSPIMDASAGLVSILLKARIHRFFDFAAPHVVKPLYGTQIIPPLASRRWSDSVEAMSARGWGRLLISEIHPPGRIRRHGDIRPLLKVRRALEPPHGVQLSVGAKSVRWL